jgi:hypothetical protein
LAHSENKIPPYVAFYVVKSTFAKKFIKRKISFR